MSKPDIVFIPGAGHLASSMWPLQEKSSDSIFPIDYRRGFRNGERDTTRHVLKEYADRAFEKIVRLDRPVDLYGHSMGALVGLGVIQRADLEDPGLVRNLIAINPGVFHGPPRYNFHRTFWYAHGLMFPSQDETQKTAEALERIRSKIPEFEYLTAECTAAMYESGDGVIMIPRGFDRKRLRIYYSHNDKIIPPDIVMDLAKRIRKKAIVIPGHGHMLPLHDTDGEILEQIRSENP